MIKTVIKDIFLKQTLNIQKTFSTHKDLPFLLERKKLRKVKKLTKTVVQKTKKICCSHMNFKTSTKSWFKTKKGTQGHSIQSKSMVETIH